jgi:peptide deformylase
MKLEIVGYGHPVLRQKCAPVAEITDDIKQLVADMIETMDAADGIGIAAPQWEGPYVFLFYAATYKKIMGNWSYQEPIVYINHLN